ncbi:MAG: ATP-dependent metallopeptidase FtsH/Yme1/Tma family protein [Gemmatimonadetes bacterium]|nr:ATP-dependent metallopeptidase FtsH/Yme1/Tma family protein [Gemmatimonadota bacterium]
MPERDGNRGGRGTRWTRLSRTASFWILIILVPVLIMQLVSPQRQQAVELSYTQFMEQLQSDNVKELTIMDGKAVEGKLRTPLTVQRREVKQFRTLLPIKDSHEILSQIQAAGVEDIKSVEARRNWWSIFLGIVPWLILIGIWLFVMRQMQVGGSKAFQFGKSKARLLTGDTPKVTFADVAGCDEAKDELQEIIEFLKDPQKFTRLGGRLPKGALLVGPPGTGKTLLARAVAGEAGRPFFSMSGSDFVEMFVGVGASRVRDLFEQGKSHAPCIIFIDEIDAVGRHRGAGLGGGHDEREQTLNQLLVEMDGFESNDGVILLAATNRPDVLDPALLRPGRFDRQIVVDSPDVKGREGILRVHLRKVPLANNVDVSSLAKGTPGMSGADLANLVNEAALLAARRDQEKVFMADLDDAKDKLLLGAERKSLVLSESERRLTAYHEAGHAVVALRTPGLDPVHKITIVPRGRALGVTASLPEEDRHSYSRDYLLAQLAMLFGGRAAEELVFGAEKITTGAGNDIERATQMARRMVSQFGMSEQIGPVAVGDAEQEIFLGREIFQRRPVAERTAELVDAEVKRLIDAAYGHARQTLEANRDLLVLMADTLLEVETLDREQVEALAAGKPLKLAGRSRSAGQRRRGAAARAQPPEDAAAALVPAGAGEPEEAAAEAVSAPAARGSAARGVAAAKPKPDPTR